MKVNVFKKQLLISLRLLLNVMWSILKKMYWIARIGLSLTVNYSIYYFRRFVLFQSDQKARRLNDEQYEQYLKDKAEVKKSAKPSETAPINLAAEAHAPALQTFFSAGPLREDNLHIHSLWIGAELSKIELLTLASFIKHGHTFHLWVYDKLTTPLPAGVVLEDANDIIPREKIFRYRHSNKYGHGKGSVSGFSDIFRYKLLYEKGGWWVDMDVTCLQPLNVIHPYFFRKHHELNIVGNVLKCPPRSALMHKCYTEAIETVDENNTDWHKPIEILNKFVQSEGLAHYISPPVSNWDKWADLSRFILDSEPLLDHYYFVHWMNEEWRSKELDKNSFRYKSTLGRLMIDYGLIKIPDSRLLIFLNDIKYTFFLRLLYA